jgi:hypothetical protein
MNSRPQPNSRTASDGNSALSNRATGQAGYRRGFSSEIGTGEGLRDVQFYTDASSHFS